MAVADRQGEGFTHRVIAPSELLNGARLQQLTVFIEGDGRPWRHGHYIARQPDGRQPLALKLMVATPQPALYLGRPCYLGLAASPGCSEKYWTSHRYSAEVVASMVAALRHLLAELGQPSLRLVGYSGGGALATLMAASLPRGTTVVTLAGNLDTELWSEHHRYLPLSGSQNPLASADMTRVHHYHYVGAQDDNVPPALATRFTAVHGGSLTIINDIDHRCCWLEHWSASINPETSIEPGSIKAK